MRFVGEAKGLRGSALQEQIQDVIRQTGIEAVKGRRIAGLPKGYRQRVGIVQALLGSPKAIILDEPTVGLDPIQIIDIRELIKELGKQHTVIFSSHILSEVQTICDQVLIIANGKRDNILTDILRNEELRMKNEELKYTRFIPSPEPVSSVKKWIAHSEGFAKGELHINECATKILASDKAVSILPIGITDVRGGFEKDDIVRIIDHTGNAVGVGKANCNSEQAREAMGKHGKKPVVHYDYLYIE